MMSQTETLYLCQACGVVYDPRAGWPEEGFAPGTPWEAIPDDWRCPECGVTKRDFVPLAC
ncbi:rubredoxin [Paludibacterium sp. THUN1379]|nr:rubredoxin [Paludibacterium sp. THUN1379]